MAKRGKQFSFEKKKQKFLPPGCALKESPRQPQDAIDNLRISLFSNGFANNTGDQRLPRYAIVIVLMLIAGPAFTQATPSKTPSQPTLSLDTLPSWPHPLTTETSSIGALVAAFDTVLSAPAGGKLDRNRLRSLFIPDGRIVIEVAAKPNRPADVVFVTPDQYADLSDGQTAHVGFFDRVIANGIERFGDMAHVYSSYDSRHTVSDPHPFARGIKSFELLLTDGQWRIVQVFYEREGPDNLLPEAWLHDRKL